MEKQKPLKEKVSLSIDSDIIKSCRTLADKDDRSLSQYVNRVLREHLREINPSPYGTPIKKRIFHKWHCCFTVIDSRHVSSHKKPHPSDGSVRSGTDGVHCSFHFFITQQVLSSQSGTFPA